MTTLAELQTRFGAAIGARSDGVPTGLVAAIVAGGLSPAARLEVYRNNARAMFETALERSYPVLRRRVGDGYFRRLATDYRAAHPSTSGDLQWVGAAFPDWLAATLAGGDYAWLAELAGLEWACEQALVAAELPALGLEALVRIAPEAIADTRFTLQPCLRLLRSDYPVWSVWCANQPGGSGASVDLAQGGECVVVARDGDQLALRSVPPLEFALVQRLQAGVALGAALEQSSLAIEALPPTLAWLFGDGLVAGLASGPSP